VHLSKPTALLATFGSLALACLIFSRPAFAEAILRTAACSTLSKVTYNGRDYTIRNYAVRHNLEWKNPNEEFDLQLHEQASDTFPPLANVVRGLVREAKGKDGRELSGSESAQVVGVYGTAPGPVVFPARHYAYDWNSTDEGVRTDEVDGKVVGRYRVMKRKISDEVELIRQVLVDAPASGAIAAQSQETSCFRFKQPRWMWSELVPAPLETAAATFDPLIYAVDNAWNQLKECRAAKGSCESLEKIYSRAVTARDRAWKVDSTIQQLRNIGRKPDARGLAFTRFPEDVQLDEQGWLVLDQGSGYLNHLGEKTSGENLSAPDAAIQKILEQQQLLAADAAGQARAAPSPSKPEAAPAPAAPDATASMPAPAQRKVTRGRAVAEAALHAAPKLRSAARSEAKTTKHAVLGRSVAARVRAIERTQPIPQASSIARIKPRTGALARIMRAPDEDFDERIMPVRRWPPLEPPQRYVVRVGRDVSPFYFLFED
jgi:hypothetical protein